MKIKNIYDTKISKVLSLHTWHSFNKDGVCNMIINVIDEGFENKYSSSIKNTVNKFVTDNKFISNKDKDSLHEDINKAFRNLYLAKKYTYLWKVRHRQKHITYGNTTDLLLEELDETKTISILDKKHVFRFTNTDIVQMFKNNFKKCDYQNPKINCVRNPYTQKKFKKDQLYAIYIGSRMTKEPMFWMLREFANLEFNTNDMLRRHYSYFKYNAILEDVHEMSSQEFKSEASYLIKKYIINKYYKNNVNSFPVLNLNVVPESILRKDLSNCIVKAIEMSIYSAAIFYKDAKEEISKTLLNFWTKHPEIVHFKRRSVTSYPIPVRGRIGRFGEDMTLPYLVRWGYTGRPSPGRPSPGHPTPEIVNAPEYVRVPRSGTTVPNTPPPLIRSLNRLNRLFTLSDEQDFIPNTNLRYQLPSRWNHNTESLDPLDSQIDRALPTPRDSFLGVDWEVDEAHHTLDSNLSNTYIETDTYIESEESSNSSTDVPVSISSEEQSHPVVPEQRGVIRTREEYEATTNRLQGILNAINDTEQRRHTRDNNPARQLYEDFDNATDYIVSSAERQRNGEDLSSHRERILEDFNEYVSTVNDSSNLSREIIPIWASQNGISEQEVAELTNAQSYVISSSLRHDNIREPESDSDSDETILENMDSNDSPESQEFFTQIERLDQLAILNAPFNEQIQLRNEIINQYGDRARRLIGGGVNTSNTSISENNDENENNIINQILND
tara:strand:- start:3672 stop:5849 length:2178 start_codon:yes stop_codon:yes gene_type:complete